MTTLPHIQYFLGANSPSGFYSLYDQLLPPEQARAIYIVKGGPGCGKSTLMRRVAAQAEEAGHPVERILCSGDPDSLDAVVIPDLRVAIADGTAPHVIEPKLPGAVERYVDMGRCYNFSQLYPLRSELTDRMKGYKGCYARAYRCLGAASEILEDQRAALVTDELSHKLAKRAKGILSRELPRKQSVLPGQVRQRFLAAVTHRGQLCLFDSALAQCGRIYALEDNCGLAHELLIHLLAGAVSAGYDVVACPDHMAPERLAHLLIPQLELAFLSSTKALPYTGPAYRRIRLDAAADGELLRRDRPRLRFARKVSAALVDEAVSSLAQAKAMHDALEAVYNPHVNFDLVDTMAQSIGKEILSF